MEAYQFFVYIALTLSLLWNSCFGALFPSKTQTRTVSVNGSLSAVDALGRQTVSAGKSDKKVGVFYFLWNGEETTTGPYDVTKIEQTDPQAYLSAERWEAAGGGPYAHWHFWSEPLFGYYFQSDKWVLSRHCQMLTDAGVDFMVFDTTNARAYVERAIDLIDVWHAYLEDGWNVPKLAFYTNASSGQVMNEVYDRLYHNAEMKAKYPRLDELWFNMNNKPMIIGNENDEALRKEVRDYFRIKGVQWPNFDKNPDGFPWMEFNNIGTLKAFYKSAPWNESIMNVSAAQHLDTVRFSSSAWYNGNDHGRSWHDGAKDESEDAVLHGYNFAEQWDFAIKLDPDIVFVTGFNEWTAMRLGIAEEPIVFVDNCDTEYSRDVEPSAGILGDNYYMQLAQYITKFKNSTSVLPNAPFVSIDIDGGFAQWDNAKITSVYRDFKGDVFDRANRGFGDLFYTDDSGRNDIVNAKVCQDANSIYFYVDTAETLTSETDDAWMTLFLNVNGEKAGYDFCVNRTSPADGKTLVEQVTGEGFSAIGEAQIRFAENRLMLKVPKTLLGFRSTETASFTFKWADHYVEGDVYSFYTKGDSAPYGRLNFVF